MTLMWLAPLAMAGELSLMGKVLALHRDHLTDSYFVKMQGLSITLKSPEGEVYRCLRKGLNSQEILLFSFDPKTLRVQNCEPRSML